MDHTYLHIEGQNIIKWSSNHTWTLEGQNEEAVWILREYFILLLRNW